LPGSRVADYSGNYKNIRTCICIDLTRFILYESNLKIQFPEYAKGEKMSDFPNKLKYCAGGKWFESKTRKYMDCYNPSTGEGIVCRTRNPAD